MVSAVAARKTVSVLFCDLADSTALGERLDPELLRELLAVWYEEMRAAVERHGGTVEKFVGDAVMAVFGLPQAHEDDALRAVRAALEMQTEVERINSSVGANRPELEIRIGINTGEVVSGGDTETLVTGDAVNTAKRLEQAAAGGEILVGAVTERLVRHAARLEPVPAVAAKGKTAPVEAWRVFGTIAGAETFARRSDTPLVGRTRELGILRDELAASADGRSCRLVTVIGEAGVGKTRLVSELVAEVGTHATVVSGRCLPYGDGITFWPLTELMRRFGDEDAVAEAVSEEPDAQLVVERLRVLGSGGAARPEELFWAVRRFFEALARPQPLVVVLEDVHWAEATLLDLVEYVSRWGRDSRILLLCVARDELLEERPRWEGTIVRLGPLSPEEASELLRGLDDGAILSPELRARVADVAQGNPLYAEQLVAMLADEARAATELVALPPTIQALLTARLDHLDPVGRSVLERAAVVGKEFWAGAVAALGGRGQQELGSTLLGLVRRDLVEPAPSSIPGEDGFRFRHGLIQDAVYAGIPKRVRADLHERFAGWLELNDDSDEFLGYHLEQVYRYRDELGALDDHARSLGERAGELLTAAGRRALGRDDVPAAVNLLERGVALLPRTNGSRGYVLLELAIALMRSGGFRAAEGALEESLALARAAGDRRLELRTLIEREFFRMFTAAGTSAEEVTRVAETAIPVLEELGDDAGLTKAWHLLSEPPAFACRWGERAAALERALEHARRAGDPSEAAFMAASLMHAIQMGPTPVDAAIDRAHLFLNEMQGDRLLTASILSSLAVLLAMRGQFPEAREEWARARALWDDLGMAHRRAVRAIDASAIESLAGDGAAAERELRTGYRMLEEIGETPVRTTISAYLAAVLAQEGRSAEAEEFARFAESNAAEDDIVTQVMWRVARAQALAPEGEAAEAERLAREAVELAAPTDFLDLQSTALLALARVLREAGSAEAANVAAEAQAVYERKGNVAGAGWAALLAET